MRKLEHIGIAVRNLEESNRLFAKLLGVEHYKIEEVEREGVRTSFFNVGNVKIELLEATRPDSAIATFIEKRGEGIHHLAFDVEDVQQQIVDFTADGFKVLSETPMPGADNKMIAFLHPKTTNGVLVEICQEKTLTPNSSLLTPDS
jgi:methylmalonyl-CoA/ethylmalonyl-CoA epimerase